MNPNWAKYMDHKYLEDPLAPDPPVVPKKVATEVISAKDALRLTMKARNTSPFDRTLERANRAIKLAAHHKARQAQFHKPRKRNGEVDAEAAIELLNALTAHGYRVRFYHETIVVEW